MKIIINGKFYGQRRTGVQRFAGEIVKRLDEICGGNVELVVPENAAANLPAFHRIKVVIRGKKANTVWEQTAFARYVRKTKGISLNLCNSAPLFARKIVCIHDMKIRAYPQFFSKKFLLWYRLLFKNVTKKAEAIITVSAFSKSEIEKYYPCAKGKIYVVPNAWQHFGEGKEDPEVLSRFGVQKGSYLFSMSSLEPNKNLKWLVEVAKRNPAETFIVAGGVVKGVFADAKEDFPENVKAIGYADDNISKTLMAGCKAFVFVPFYEGFGLPPVEALAVGAPAVIASDIPVLHEVLEDCAVYVDPERYSYEIADLLAGLGPSKKTCLEKYAWSSSAAALWKVLEQYGSGVEG